MPPATLTFSLNSPHQHRNLSKINTIPLPQESFHIPKGNKKCPRYCYFVTARETLFRKKVTKYWQFTRAGKNQKHKRLKYKELSF